MDNNYIDEMVRDSIGEYEMAFNPADWDAMESHLEKDNRVRRKLYATKAIEACLMLVTVWTIMQFVEIDNSSSYQPTLIEHQENISSSVDDEQVGPLQGNDKQQDEKLERAVPPQNTLNPLLKNVPIANSSSSSFETVEVSEGKVKESSFNNNEKSKNVDFKKIIDETNNTPIASLEMKLFDATNNTSTKGIPSSVTQVSIDQEDGSQNLKARNFRIGGFVAGDAVNINTPNNYLVAKKAHMFNVSTGLIIDRKLKEKLRVETGAIFAYRKHSERTFDIGASNYDMAMENSTINTASIEIPINVLYEICSNEKNTVYALGGVSNHFALTIKKETEEFIELNSTPVLTQVGGFDATATRSEGLFITKEVRDNHFASVNVGAGYERKLNQRISLFAQATFKKGFGKLGFHDDDITTVSLSAGVKSIL